MLLRTVGKPRHTPRTIRKSHGAVAATSDVHICHNVHLATEAAHNSDWTTDPLVASQVRGGPKGTTGIAYSLPLRSGMSWDQSLIRCSMDPLRTSGAVQKWSRTTGGSWLPSQ